MHQATRIKILRYLLPSLSEFEFIFISSLFTFAVLAKVIWHIESIRDYIVANGASSWYLILGITFVALIFLGSFIYMSVTAYRRPFLFGDLQARVNYVMLPATILILIGITDFFISGFKNTGLISIILLARYTVVVFMGSLINYSFTLQIKIAALLDDYQVNTRAAIGAIVIGAIGAAIVLSTRDQLAWLIIVSSLGQMIIRLYKDIIPSKSSFRSR